MIGDLTDGSRYYEISVGFENLRLIKDFLFVLYSSDIFDVTSELFKILLDSLIAKIPKVLRTFLMTLNSWSRQLPQSKCYAGQGPICERYALIITNYGNTKLVFVRQQSGKSLFSLPHIYYVKSILHVFELLISILQILVLLEMQLKQF